MAGASAGGCETDMLFLLLLCVEVGSCPTLGVPGPGVTVVLGSDPLLVGS